MSEGSDRSNTRRGENAGSPRSGDALRPHLVSLRRPVDGTPDFTRSILAEVGEHRAWLDSRERRMIRLGRLAGVAAAIAIGAGVFFIQRETPVRELANGPAPQPIGELVRSVSADALRVDVARALDTSALGRVVIAEPLARVIRAEDRPRTVATVWSVQRLVTDQEFTPTRDGALRYQTPEMASFAPSAPMQANAAMQQLGSASILATPNGDATWTASFIVPAAFQAPAPRASSPAARDGQR